MDKVEVRTCEINPGGQHQNILEMDVSVHNGSMEPAIQELLVVIPEQPAVIPLLEPALAVEPVRGKAKLRPIDRSQGFFRPVVVDELVGADHKVRAIWDLTGELDLSGFLEKVKSEEGKKGRAAWDPRLLLSVWLYGYSEQVTSAREIERLMEYEPGLMWLSGLGEVNHHTLSDFRSSNAEALKRLLGDLLGALSKEGYVNLERIAHDGTKIRAHAGSDTFRREPTLAGEIAKAQAAVEELDQQEAREEQAGQGANRGREAARARAARERLGRMQQAAGELQRIREGKAKDEEKEQARVSLTEPEARLMKHGDNAFAPSYNVQISTETSHKIIVGVHVTQSSSDSGSLLPAMEEVKATTGQYPQQVIADGGFTNQASIAAMKDKEIDFYGSLAAPERQQAAAMKAAGIAVEFSPARFVILEENNTLQCPAGKTLLYQRQSQKRGDVYHQYQAQGSDCGSCAFQKQCCPKHAEQGRTVSIKVTGNPDVAEFRKKMETIEAQHIYKQRGAVAEFPNCWIKEKLGLRKFRLSGLAKAATEALWAVVTYDVLQWARLRKQSAAVVA
jgi:transposase